MGLRMVGTEVFRRGQAWSLGKGYVELREIVLMLERVAVVISADEEDGDDS